MKKNTVSCEIPTFKITELKCKENPQREFEIARFDYFAQDIEHLYLPHRHEFYTLMMATEGQGSHDIDFTTYEIRPYRQFFISPGQIHAWREIDNIKGYIIFFTEDFFSLRYNNNVLAEFPFFNSLQNEPFIQLSEQNIPYVHKLTEILYCEFLGQLQYADTVLRSYLNILLCELTREYLPPGHNRVSSQGHILVRNFEHLINANFRTQKHPREYAERLFITPNYLNEVCKQVTGKSAGALIRKRIVIEAQRLLVHTTKTVSEVAYDLNFDDASYFCRFFKKETQKSPETFRSVFS